MQDITIQARLDKNLAKKLEIVARRLARSNRSEAIRTVLQGFCSLTSREQTEFFKRKSITAR